MRQLGKLMARASFGFDITILTNLLEGIELPGSILNMSYFHRHERRAPDYATMPPSCLYTIHQVLCLAFCRSQNSRYTFHKGALRRCIYPSGEYHKETELRANSSHRHETVLSVGHRLNVGMWNGIEFVELELVIRSNVDVGALVFGTVAVFWCRENYFRVSHEMEDRRRLFRYL